MVLHHVGTNTSTALAATSGLLNISPVALHKWMRRFGPFLEASEARARGPWREAVTEPWRVMVFVWQTLMAALLPISLRDVPLGLERFLGAPAPVQWLPGA
jgi:hypothetical protein